MKWILVILLSNLMLSHPTVDVAPTEEAKLYMIKRVNQLRAKGCKCGGKRMKPTTPVKWNDKLYNSALSHAREMKRYNFFAHFSIDGDDIGDRLDNHGYNWAVAGENIGEGQRHFDEVFYDWIKSTSHCKMLMNPNVNEMAVARSGRYWVQHFGKQIPEGARKRPRN